MANAIPMNESTPGAGGYLVIDNYGETLVKGIRRESAIAQLAGVEQLNGRRTKYPVYLGRPTVSVVSESGVKPVTGAEYTQIELNVAKFVTQTLFTEELLEDAREDPRILVGQDIEGAFANAYDAHAIGQAVDPDTGTLAAVTTAYDTSLLATTASVDLGTKGDAFATAVSQAMEIVEGNGGNPNGIMAASDLRGYLRDARRTGDNDTEPVYTAGYGAEPDSIYGRQIAYTSNLDGFPKASVAGEDKVVAIVGDWQKAKFGMRRDLGVRWSDVATVTVGGVQRSVWERNEIVGQWESRSGFQVYDLNRNFVKIINRKATA